MHNSYITKFVPLDFRTSHWLQASQAFGQRLERNPQAELQMVGAKKTHRIMCHIFVHKIMQKNWYWIHKSLDTQGLQKVCRFIPGIWQARKVQTDQLRVAWPRAGRSQALRRFELSNVAMSKECVFDDWIILAGSTYATCNVSFSGEQRQLVIGCHWISSDDLSYLRMSFLHAGTRLNEVSHKPGLPLAMVLPKPHDNNGISIPWAVKLLVNFFHKHHTSFPSWVVYTFHYLSQGCAPVLDWWLMILSSPCFEVKEVVWA